MTGTIPSKDDGIKVKKVKKKTASMVKLNEKFLIVRKLDSASAYAIRALHK